MTNEDFIRSIALPGEEWRDVVGYEGRYIVSSFGRIASCGSSYKQGSYICRKRPKLKATPKGNRGYLIVSLSDGEKRVSVKTVHRIVAEAFIPNDSNLPQINHKDENPLNNKVSNLEWCTQVYNVNYGTHKEKMVRSLRKSVKNSRPVVQLSPNGDFIATFSSASEAARSVGTYDSTIVRCCAGTYKTGKGFRWMYLSDYESQVSMSKNSTQSSTSPMP